MTNAPVKNPPRLGVIAIGRNEGERLRRCLASVDVSLALLVYVDSASTDGSAAHAAAIGALVVELDVKLPFTAARARNAGLAALVERHPRVEYVQFIDGDCEIERGWISTASSFLDEHPDIAVVCGRRRERFPEASFYNRICDSEWNTPIGEAEACGGDALMRCAPLMRVGGYDPALSAGEEPELCHRLRQQGWRIWRLDVPMTIHDAAMTRFRQWWLRAVRSGMGYAQAWCATRGHSHPLYRRECLRALAWTLGVVAIAILAWAIWGWAGCLVAPLIWSLQFLRLAAGHGLREGALLLVGKLAETVGIVAFVRRAIGGRAGGTIFYK